MTEVEVEISLRDSELQVGLDALDAAEAVAFQMLTFIAGVFKNEKAEKWAYVFAEKFRAQASVRKRRDQNRDR